MVNLLFLAFSITTATMQTLMLCSVSLTFILLKDMQQEAGGGHSSPPLMAKNQGGHLAWQCSSLTSMNTMPLHSTVLSLAARDKSPQLIKPLPMEASMLEVG